MYKDYGLLLCGTWCDAPLIVTKLTPDIIILNPICWSWYIIGALSIKL